METLLKDGSNVALSPIAMEVSSDTVFLMLLVGTVFGRIARVLTGGCGGLEVALHTMTATVNRIVTAKKLPMAAKTAWREGSMDKRANWILSSGLR